MKEISPQPQQARDFAPKGGVRRGAGLASLTTSFAAAINSHRLPQAQHRKALLGVGSYRGLGVTGCDTSNPPEPPCRLALARRGWCPFAESSLKPIPLTPVRMGALSATHCRCRSQRRGMLKERN